MSFVWFDDVLEKKLIHKESTESLQLPESINTITHKLNRTFFQ